MRCHRNGCDEPAVWQGTGRNRLKTYCLLHLPSKKGKFIRIKAKDDQQKLF